MVYLGFSASSQSLNWDNNGPLLPCERGASDAGVSNYAWLWGCLGMFSEERREKEGRLIDTRW